MMHVFKYGFLNVLLFFIGTCIASSQYVNFSFEHLTSEDGLPNNRINCMIKDSQGFMWFGTRNGLTKYDGYEFVVYKTKSNNPNSISGNNITCLLEDEQGYIWIGTTEFGLNRFDKKTELFERFMADEPKSGNISSNAIACLFALNNNELLVGTFGGGLNVFNKKNSAFTHFKNNLMNTGSMASNYISSIATDSNGKIWLANNCGDLMMFNKKSGSFVNFDYGMKVKGSESFHIYGNIFIDSKNRIWIGTQEGVFIFHQKENRFEHISEDPPYKLKNKAVTGIHELNNDNFILTSNHGGINILNYHDKINNYYLHDLSEKTSLSNNQIYCMIIDEVGNYWFGNYNGGVNVHYVNRKKFHVVTPNPAKKNSLRFPSVISFFQDKKDVIWFGTDGGGLYKINPDNDELINLNYCPNDKRFISSNVVTCIFQDSNMDYWIGTYEGGLTRFNYEFIKIKQYIFHPNVKTSLLSNTIWRIIEDSKGELWILTSEGLVRYNKVINGFNRYELNGKIGNYYERTRASVIFEDSKQEIWLGTAKNGMYKYNRALDKFERVELINDSATNVNLNAIHSISEDQSGSLWFASYSGIYCLKQESETFEVLGDIVRLPEMIKTKVIEDEKGNMWFGSNEGIIKYNPEDKAIRTFTINDGLPANEINNEAILAASGGKLYFGSQNGYVSFYPDSILDYTVEPNIAFSSFYLFNQEVKIGADNGILKAHINEIDTVFLTHKQDVFTIKYVALNYQNAEHNTYAYRLEGFDKDWNYVENERKANYTNLDHGTYVFHVKAANSDGYWNETGRKLTIIIKPPFWLTWWYKSLMILLILIAVLGSHALRVRSIRLQKKKLKRLVQERTQELNEVNTMLEEMNDEVLQQKEEILSQKDSIEIKNEELQILNATKDRFFSIIAHDLRGPIGTLYVLGKQLWERFYDFDAQKQLKLIKHIKDESSNSFSLLESLLEWSRSQLEQVKFEPVKFQLSTVVNATIALLEPFAQNKNIDLISNIDSNDTVFADQNMIATVFRNLVSNAIKFTESRGKVTIKSQTIENRIKIEVSDTGVGIKEEDLEKIFKIDESLSTKGTSGESGTGLGLILCKEFLDKNGSSIAVESKVGVGSIFKFSLPINSEK